MTYTNEETTKAIDLFNANTELDEIALQLGKSVKSVIAKLSQAGVYHAKAKTAAKAKGATKADIVAKLAAELQVDVAKLESLNKATKDTLELILEKLSFDQE